MIASTATFLTTAATLLALSQPQDASTGPVHSAFVPGAVVGHDHDGPLGDKLLYLEHLVRCTCSCNLDAHTCQYQMQCDTSPGFTARILQELEAGVSEEVILAGFVADYGPTILLAPPMEGFNRVGYFMPAMAILFTGALIGMALRRGAKTTPEPATVEASRVSDEEWDKLQAELRVIEEEDADW